MTEKLYLKEYPIDMYGECSICGRLRSGPDAECHCGEIITNRSCSLHLNVLMRRTAIPIYKGNVIIRWVDMAECAVIGCGYVRAIKDGQGVPRNENRKGAHGNPRKSQT